MTKNMFSICLKKRVKSFQKNVSSPFTNVVSPHVTQVMSWQHLNNGLKSNKVKKSLRNSLANRYFYSLLSKTKSLHSCEGFLC